MAVSIIPERPKRVEPSIHPEIQPTELSPYLVVVRSPNSIAAEQYRLLAHSIERRMAPKSGPIAVISALEAEGKTVTALNLSFALAETKRQTICLCDIDLRGGRIGRAVGIGEPPGVVEILRGKKTLLETVRRINSNLAVVPAGAAVPNPLALLRSAGFRTLMETLRTSFDYLLLDCPPLCMSEDMSIIDDVVVRMLFVVRVGATTSEAVRDAMTKMPGEKAIGVVLNDVPFLHKRYRQYKQEA